MEASTLSAQASSSKVRTTSASTRLARPEAWFYPIASVLFIAIVLWGFQQFYFQGRQYPGRDIAPPLKLVVITHGVAMAFWMILFAVQPMLVAANRVRMHMTLGKIGAVLAAFIVASGVTIAVRAGTFSPPDMVIAGLKRHEFFAVPLLSIVFFGVMVGVAIWKRKTPRIHKAMLIGANLLALSAALSRVDVLNATYAGTVWERLFGPFLFSCILGVFLLALRCVLLRGWDKWLGIATAIVIGYAMFIPWIARTDAWVGFAKMVIG